jgi:hypothetical protein
MGSRILLVCTCHPIGTYLIQEKVMQGQTLEALRINTLWLKWRKIVNYFIKPFERFKA